MASRLMHYIVGSQVMKRIRLQNTDRFLFGNMLPDCVDGPGGEVGRRSGRIFGSARRKLAGKGITGTGFGISTRRFRTMSCISDIFAIL